MPLRTLFSTGGMWMLLLVCLTAPTARAQEDDEDEVLLPGLIATYEAPNVKFERYDATPQVRLTPGQTPDPRLPTKGWRVRWVGAVQIKAPGAYQFEARGSGTGRLLVDGRPVLEFTATDKPVQSEPVELEFGLRPVEIEFAPQGDGAELHLNWSSARFQSEPLPAFAIGHRKVQGSIHDGFLAGQILVEEHSCVACHFPSEEMPLAKRLEKRPGPKLVDAGARLKTAWIVHWLADPQRIRPEAVMPRLFPEGRDGEIERLAVAALLTSRGKPPSERNLNEQQRTSWPKTGQQIFEQRGCVVCHEKQNEFPPRATLRALSEKLPLGALVSFLQNPAAVDPAGRMPAFSFEGDEVWQVALFLQTLRAENLPALPRAASKEELAGVFARLNPDAALKTSFKNGGLEAQLHAVGRAVMRERRCANCHEIKFGGEETWKPHSAEHNLAAIAQAADDAGCLRSEQGDRPNVPLYGPGLSREAAKRFLSAAIAAPATEAPGYKARVVLERLNCTGCHQRNQTGGLSTDLVAQLLKNQTEQAAEAIAPPPLTGIAEKLLEPALRGVLLNRQRVRPWMSLQMPHFESHLVADLPQLLAADDGDQLEQVPYKPAATAALLEAGRTLVGEKGFACIKCHDMFDIPNQGTRGPDLAKVTERVTYGWFERWMHDPQRMAPGTRMPTVFFQGKSPYDKILDGHPNQQVAALWQYLLVSRSLPHPEGLQAPRTLQFPEGRHTQLVRTFLPDTSARAFAVRHANGVHLAFDAQACRLAYAWSGGFLDMQPVWNGRGGNKAILEGATFWTSPGGFPWDVTTSLEQIPDFSKHAGDPTLGAVTGDDGKVYERRVHFLGYRLRDDATELRYSLNIPESPAAQFVETISTLRASLAVGAVRSLRAEARAGQVMWFQVAVSERAPQLLAAEGSVSPLVAETGLPVGDDLLMVWQQGKPVLLRVKDATADTRWKTTRQGDRWSVMLQRLVTEEAPVSALKVVILCPFDGADETIRSVAAEERQRK